MFLAQFILIEIGRLLIPKTGSPTVKYGTDISSPGRNFFSRRLNMLFGVSRRSFSSADIIDDIGDTATSNSEVEGLFLLLFGCITFSYARNTWSVCELLIINTPVDNCQKCRYLLGRGIIIFVWSFQLSTGREAGLGKYLAIFKKSLRVIDILIWRYHVQIFTRHKFLNILVLYSLMDSRNGFDYFANSSIKSN